MTYNEDTRMFTELSKFTVRCKCSHTMVMAKADRTICSHCGNWVYRTPEIEFKYKMKESLIKEVKNDN